MMQKISKKAFITILALFILLAIFIASENFSFTKQKNYTISKRDVLSAQIGDKLFEIPKVFVWSASDFKSGALTGLNIQALLPMFDPVPEVSEANQKEISKRRLLILLEEHSMPPNDRPTGHISMTRKETFSRRLNGRPYKEEEFSHELLSIKFLKNTIKNEEMFISRDDKGSLLYWVSCSKEESNPNPRCGTYLEYSSNVYVQYSFPRSQISNWKSIDRGVISLVKSFEKKGDEK
jgi:hypothetical protein